MQNTLSQIKTISKWEIRRFTGTMSRDLLPIAFALFILLILASGFAQQNGIHLQDNIYTVGIDDESAFPVISTDNRFTVYKVNPGVTPESTGLDLVILNGFLFASDSDKGQAALNSFEKDYSGYIESIYNREEDLYAAYPLWIDEEYVKSEIDFTATQSGQRAVAPPDPYTKPVPDSEPALVETPSAQIDKPVEELRSELISDEGTNANIERYANVLSSSKTGSDFKTPSQISPPLPFDSIILVFIFIFPLYFTSQFYMMSIMNERIERSGEPLLSTPVKPYAIILGKGLPYFVMMLAVAAVLTVFIGAPLMVLLPILPVILFFLSSALLIGMTARSFRELSFISIFFSTVASSYLFFPSIFANIHIVSLISPLTLVIYQIQGDGFTAYDYLYSTSLFFLTSAVMFFLAARNFNEERLFNYHRFIPRLTEFIGSVISEKRTNLSLFAISICCVPFVFMVQMMLLVLLFNFPMPYSVVMLLVSAAFVEELAKSVGIYTLFSKRPGYMTWKNILAGSFFVAAGFLTGEKLLLFATLSEISDSVFGTVMFASLQVLWLPFLLHLAGVLTTSSVLKFGGRRMYIPALILATIVHSLYNLYFILGWSG
ncbi:hypothetical protein J2128_000972 [Methanomicrobium sp. W14]|uniref:ABC transporter permease n=1 Tax=Methanomicrobium sp. W14 TaxID=2817839 RepID=UPI001FDA25D7|nr:ABC transporter permease [Methanomicrobium sp. W14]MBP2133051.1 hypothetical protein [Methanomicrobium sp. W14]